MAALLEKDRSKRIGATGFNTFTSHPFFADIDFVALEARQIKPIFTPSSDKTNFDATYDLEELLLEEAPLEARARRQKPRAELKEDATPKEIREDELHKLIETMFEPFDYTTVNYETYVILFRWSKAKTSLLTSLIIIGPRLLLSLRQREYISQNSNYSASQLTRIRNPEDHLPTARPIHTRHASQPRSASGSPSQTERSVSRSNASDAGHPTHEQSHQEESNNRSTSVTPSSSPPGRPRARTYRPPPTVQQRNPGATRKMSKSGGVQMVLDETGSWSNLADPSATLPTEGYEAANKGKSSNSGMLSFLTRKKGRDRSPKPTEPGVLGKEGARQIIS